MPKDRFERLSVGMSAQLSRKVFDSDINFFAKISGDHNPIHTSDAYALEAGFEGRVVHGSFTASLISSLLGTQLPGPGTIFLEQKLRFLAPVQVGDLVLARVEIFELMREKRRARLLSECWVGKKKIIEGEALVKIPLTTDSICQFDRLLFG